AVEGEELSAQAYWFRGAWFDNLEVYWRELTQPGGLKPRVYPAAQAGARNSGSLASRLTLQPGQSQRVRFTITWSFPYFTNYWNKDTHKIAAEKGIPTQWINYYATQFNDSLVSARYALDNWDRLFEETRVFKEALYTSDLDPVVIDAIAANLAVIKSPTVLRLQNGTFYGFEGCHPNSGCCEGSCTHVWNYAQAVAFLFPALERSMREVDFTMNQRADGGMRFRLPLPSGLNAEDYWVFHPCADGQFGNVLKAYADWKISGDTKWLQKFWPAIQKAIEFAWAPTNEYRWDPEKKGVLTGRMHHTLDMELYGPDAWLNGFYLAALKAGAEMAEAMAEPEKAQEYRAVFEKGKAWVDAHLFNGEYYHQLIDLKDRSILEAFSSGAASMSGTVMDAYWNGEHQEIKYQIGEGCEIDQLLAQYHANIYGLGEIFDPSQARTALHSLYKYNFKQPMRDFYNPCRIFALNDEGGLVMCAWPEKVYKPMIPIPYSQEVMTGFEYAAATLMIQSGLV
ncbi:MAG: GH116 family glycosyl hydrolase, partial [Kiritimatiellota bacterium]|nr:GH116 family glycosyl hydrolase [Kiritimatiellota bacterium]